MSTQEKPRVVVQKILELLKKGYTRYTKDDLGYGSIQAHYGLTNVEMAKICKHPKLKAKKTIIPRDNFILIDEEEETVKEAAELVVGIVGIKDVSEEESVSSEVMSKEELFK